MENLHPNKEGESCKLKFLNYIYARVALFHTYIYHRPILRFDDAGASMCTVILGAPTCGTLSLRLRLDDERRRRLVDFGVFWAC